MTEPARTAEGRSKRRAATLSVASNITLVAGKLVVGSITGSVAVISEAIHSAMDLLAALIALVAVSLSDRPPDREHTFFEIPMLIPLLGRKHTAAEVDRV